MARLSIRSPRLSRTVLATGLVSLTLAAGAQGIAPATATGAPTTVPARAAAAPGDGFTSTHAVTRVRYEPGSSTPVTDTDTVTVTADRHTELQARERIDVSWSGAHPTGGRVGNPYGENGLDQEYPVVIMECRGVDDPHAPAAQQVSPDTCWTNTTQERSQSDDASRAIWRDDLYASDADKAQVSGTDPATLPASCPTIQDGTAYHLTPFLAVGDKKYAGCDSNHMPPEAAVGSVDPPNEVYAYTAPDGSGSAQVEVRTDTENASLGCSHTVACTLVVIPIMGLSCADDNAFCNKTGAYAPGSTNDGTTGAQAAVSPAYWWSKSNWRNRFSIPLKFALPASTCTLLGQGTPVPFYGSELLSQAALQWSPSYCLNKARFNWQSNTMPDDAAFAQMQSGSSVAAEVTGPGESDKAVGYAPTAASGFGIAFDIDDPATGLPATDVKLDARLLAKLLSESYPADAYGAKRPGIENNPWSLQTDPEFVKLNPSLALPFGRTPSQAAATLLSLSTGSGVIDQLTSYIASDPAAMDFLDGKADPWGMKVNPAYKKIQLPVSTWPLLDSWVPKNTGNSCLDDNTAPYLAKIAAPVNNLRLIAQAMLFNWPLVQTACDLDPTTGIYKLGRIARQNIGQRFMLGVVTLGDAARYGLSVASLQAAPGHFVGADTAGLSSALNLSKGIGPDKPFELDQDAVRKSQTAYPGTMVVYTAAKTGPIVTKQDGKVVSTVPGLAEGDAKNVAQFIDVSSTQGQVPGRGNGQLPGGYLPIAKSGATAKLYASARTVGADVAAQKPIVVTLPDTTTTPTTPPGTNLPGSTTPSGTIPPLTSSSDTPPGSATPPTDQPGTSPTATTDAPATTVPMASTTPVTSALGGRLLPLLLLAGLVAGLIASTGRLVLRRRGVR